MPAKAGKGEKAKEKQNKPKSDKVKIDPTFGLKNKKGKKNRQFVQNAQHNLNAKEIEAKKRRQVLIDFVFFVCLKKEKVTLHIHNTHTHKQ